MPLIVRPIQDTDAVRRFGPVHGPDTDTPRRSRSFVALVDGSLVGVVTELRSVRHPDVAQAMGSIDPAHRRSGAGRALLRAAEEHCGLPLMFMTEEHERDGAAFLAACGYSVANESWTVRVDVRAALDRLGASMDGELDLAGAGIEIAPSIMTLELADLFDRVYGERHAWAGRYTPVSGTPWITFAGKVVPPTLHVARHDGEPIAALLLTTGGFAEGADAFVPPTGPIAGTDAGVDPTALTRELLRRALAAAWAFGYKTVNLEYDTPYVELATIARGLVTQPVNHRRVWMSHLFNS